MSASAAIPADRPFRRSPAFILTCGCLVAILTFGPRATMGFFLTPMTEANGWSRETFALAIAVQNLMWGLGSPFAGMVADRFGTARTLIGGTALYIAGLVLMAYTTDPVALQLTAGVILGLGVAGSAFFLVLSAFARLLPAGMRPLAFGLGTAAGSAGQLVFSVLGQAFIEAYGWQSALLLLAGLLTVVPVLTWPLRGRPLEALAHASSPIRRDQTIAQALTEAFGHRSYNLLVLGFFVCGFHVAFITTHFPAYVPQVIDQTVEVYFAGFHCLTVTPERLGAWSIGIIGAFNIVGAIGSGILSGRVPKHYLLAGIYLARAFVCAAFVLLPPSPLTVTLFATLAGLLWLSTIPPTQGLVGVMFGIRYMATLYGFVFLSHQIGAFLGVWLGGRVFDLTGSYDLVWWMSVALGLFAAAVHLPIREAPVARLAPA
jgi:MFS family permease